MEPLEGRELLSASPLGILVPAYQYPTTGTLWNQLDAAASKIPVMAILNPNSGPGAAADSNYTLAVNTLESDGGKVVGYVHTSYGTRSLSQVEADVQAYHQLYPQVNGIFVDEMDSGANSSESTAQIAAHVAYYQSLYSYIKSVNPNWTVVTNPGTTLGPAYANTHVADTVVSFEHGLNADSDGPAYANYNPANEAATAGATNLANIVTGVATATQMQTVVNQAASQHAGWIYATDDNASNPSYGQLPSYWAQEVAAVGAVDATQPGYPALSISPSALPRGTANATYVQSIAIAGGSGTYTSLTVTGFNAGATGLTAPTANSARQAVTLAGIPRAAGTATFTVNVTDSTGATLSKTFSVTINPALSLGTLAVTTWNVNQAGFSQTIPTTGGTGAHTFAITSGVLPTGLQWNRTTGAITGTPTVVGTYNFAVAATDAAGASASRSFTLVINQVRAPLSFTLSGSPFFSPNVSFSEALAVAGGVGTVTLHYQINGTLPAGLSIHVVNNMVIISGVPVYYFSAPASVTVTATDSSGATESTTIYLVPPWNNPYF
jgi:hypothetical protein